MAIRSVIVRLQAEISSYSAGMRNAARQARAVGDEAAKAAAKHRRAMEDAGRAATVFGAVMAGGFLVSVKKAAEFEQAMSHVEAATHESALAMGQLRDAALEAGARTAFTAKESANAIEEMAKAGVKTADILGGGLNGALDLAAAGTLGVAEAAEIAASTMVQFNLAGDKVGHIADVLAAGAGKAQGSVSDMGLALSYVGPVAASMGISMEETAGAIALMANNGILAEKAGTGLRGVLSALTAPSVKAQEELNKLGVTLYDAQGQFIGFRGVAEQLNGALAGASQEQRNFSLGTIFGNAQLVAATTLLKGGAAAVDDWTNKVNDQGYAAETARLKMNNLKGDLEKLGGALDTALISSGSGALAPLRELTQGLTGVINAYGKVPPVAQQAAFGFTGIAGAAGLAAGAFLLLTPRIVATKRDLALLGKQMPRTTAAMKTLGIVAGSAFAAYAGGTIAVQALGSATEKATPGIEAVTAALLKMQSASSLGEFDSLFNSESFLGTQKMNGFADALDRVTGQGSGLQKTADVVAGVFGQKGASGYKEAAAAFEQVDAALLKMQQNGQVGRAAELFAELERKAQASGASTEQLKRALPGYADALKGVENAATLAGGGQSANAAAAAESAGAMNDERTAAERLRDALDVLNAGAVSVARAQIAFADAQQATKDAFKGSNDTLDTANKTGREHLAQVLDLIDAAQQYGEAVAEEASGTMDATSAANAGRKAYQGRIADLRATLLASGLTRKEVDALIKKYAQVPPKIRTTVGLTGADLAAERVAILVDQLNRIPSQRSVAIAVNLTGNTNLGEVRRALGKAGHADGGLISGPGTGTSDSIPALLSDGEYVVNAAATSRYRSLLEAINAGRFARGGLVGFAKGGPVTPGAGILSRIDAAASRGLAPGATAAVIAAAAAEVERLAQAWRDALDAMDKAGQRRELEAGVKAAAKALAKAKDKGDAKRDLSEARRSLAEFDRQARIDAAEKANDQKRQRLAAAQTLASNQAAYEFEHKASTDQLKNLDERLAKETRFSDTWMDLARQREQVAQQINDTQKQAVEQAQQAYDEQLSKVNGMLDEQARIVGQLAQAQDTYDDAVAGANARLAEQTEQIKATRREALAGWFDISQKAHVASAPSANSLIKNAQGQVDQFREWMAKLSDARGRGLSEGVIGALGLDQGPESLGQLRKLSTATVDEITSLNSLVQQQNELASAQVAREQSGLLGEVGRQLTAAQTEATDAQSAALAQFTAEQAALNTQLAEIGGAQGRTFADAVAQGLASGIPAVNEAAKALQSAYSGLSAAQAVSAIEVSVPVPVVVVPKKKPAKKADGGLVSGPGGPRDDAIPAWLSDGEFVVNAKATAANRRLLEAVNAGRFAMGGYVSASRIPTSRSGGGPMSVNVDNVAVQYEVRRAVEAITAQTDVIRRKGGDRPLGAASASW